MRDKLLPEQRLLGIAEELAGFLMKEITTREKAIGENALRGAYQPYAPPMI